MAAQKLNCSPLRTCV